jgi:hypothetical protein
MHKKIMANCSKALASDAKKYEGRLKSEKSPMKKKHDKTEMKEAKQGAKDMARRSKKAHEY